VERAKQSTVLLVVATGEFLTTFMVSSVVVALRAIDNEWHVSTVTLSWIPLAYILAVAALLMPAGRLADLTGRKRFFVAGMIVFTILAFASAFAPSAPVFIVLRLLNGVGTAMLYACSAAIVTLAYPPQTRGRALGIQVAGVYLGLTLGPLLGGIIIDHLGWRWVFVFTGALGAINSLLCWWGLRGIEWREPKRARFDIAGSLVWAVALTMLLIGLSMLPGTLGWVLVAAGAGGIAGFLWCETRAPDPILNLDFFRKNRVFAYSNAATFINYAATYAMTFLMSLYLQYNMGLAAQTAGLVLVTGTVVQTVFAPLAGRLADHVQARFVAAAGMAVTVLGLGALVFLRGATAYWYIITTLCVLGLGLGLFSTPIMHVIMGSVDRRYAGVASATFATMRTTGQNASQGLATLFLSVFVGRHAIEDADLPHLLTSIRVTFAILAVLCIFGVAASLVGPRREEAREGRAAADSR
jgi:EmrB/QacA subfamily drug resistance transporter